MNIFNSAVPLALLAALAIGAPSALAGGEHPEALKEHSFAYTDKDGNKVTVFLDRWGNFEKYVPCEFEAGTWDVAGGDTLTLRYGDNGVPAISYRFRIDGGAMQLQPVDGAPVLAQFLDGNKLPFG